MENIVQHAAKSRSELSDPPLALCVDTTLLPLDQLDDLLERGRIVVPELRP